MNARQISEADWRVWRRLSKIALERYCDKVLNEIVGYRQGDASAHQRYIDLYRYIQQCDETIGSVFNNPRRSTAYFSIANALGQELISSEEMNEFSSETQMAIKLILGK